MKTAALRPISARIATRLSGLLLTALSGAGVLLPSTALLAQQPSGATVAAGAATFATNGNTFTVTNTPNAIINWQSFNIGAGKTTRFEQQSPSSTVMNRVVESNPSVILGSLTSNGNVFLVNPNGILFGAGSRVDVGGLVASTLALSDANFLASNFRFTAVGSPGALTADGSINAGNGYLALIAPQINVTGAIVAGSAAFGAGAPVEIALDGGRISGQTVGTDLPSATTVFSPEHGFQLGNGPVFFGGTATFGGGTIVGSANGSILTGNGVLTLQSSNAGGLPAGGTLNIQGGNGGVATTGGGSLTIQGGYGGVATTGSGTLTVQGGNGGVVLNGAGMLTIGAGGSLTNSGGSTNSLQNSGASRVVVATGVPGRQGITISGRAATVPVVSQSTREVPPPPIMQPAIEGVRRYGPTIFAPAPGMVVAPLIGLAPAQVTLNLSKRESTF